MKKYILALDQGTTSSRAVLINHGGDVVGIAQKEFRQIFPSPGLVEHDPLEIWSSQAAVIAELLAQKKIDSNDIAAIGITNQRETTIVWDRKTGEPLMNAIVWQDRRTAPLCEKLKKEGLEQLFRRKTGLVLDPYFSATKVHWILHNVPGAMQKALNGELAFGTVDSWLIWKLTNGQVHATDITNASRTMLFDIHTCQWDEEILRILGIPYSMLPKVLSCSESFAMAHSPIFSTPIPITGVAGDQQAALFGQMCVSKGMAKCTYGTGCFLLMNTGTTPVFSKNNLLTTIASKRGGTVEYALEGSVFVAGAAMQWMRDNMGFVKTSHEIDRLAESVPSSDGVYFVPAFTGLGAPHWDPYARGVILGITRGTKAAHIARAALEGVAYQATDVLQAMIEDSGTTLKEMRVDGGMAHSDLLMQFQADLIDAVIVRPKIMESTALGAAFFAGLAIGFWKNEEEIAGYWKEEKTFFPQKKKEEVKALRSKWSLAIACAKLWGTQR
ncbi:MAG: glycerol kinase GlpK [Chlamydiae bacterium]|nr:glycerol kinase GlpK [Chlamydiota bacterium]